MSNSVIDTIIISDLINTTLQSVFPNLLELGIRSNYNSYDYAIARLASEPLIRRKDKQLCKKNIKFISVNT